MESRADEDLEQKIESLYHVIRGERFLERRGLGNELPFFISAYHPSLQNRMNALVPSLARRLSNDGVSTLLLNLYDLTVELLQARDRWTGLLDREPEIPKDKFFQTMLNVTAPKDQLVPLIAGKLAEASYRVLLLEGVGLVFPYLRTHSVLENLQSVTKQTPTVLFFPGDYSFMEGKGSYLKLFSRLPDDRYYRAFNIADFRA